jgi:hypothetical protein
MDQIIEKQLSFILRPEEVDQWELWR